MRKICYLMMIVAALGLVMTGCEEADPQVDKPTPENPNDTETPEDPNEGDEPNDPETPEDPNEGDEPKDPEQPEDPEQPTEAPFEIEIIEKTEMSFMYNVYPKDENMEYIYLFDTAKNLAANNVTTDEEIPAFLLETIKREAEAYGTSVEEHVRTYYITTGEVRMVEVNGIPPGDEFVIYVYGVEFVDGMPVPSTEVVTVHDTTLEVEVGVMPIDIKVEVDGGTATVTTDPGEYNGAYFIFVDELALHFPDTTPTEEQMVEKATELYYRSLALYLQFGFSVELALQEITYTGINTDKYDLDAETEYFVIAVPVDTNKGIMTAYPTVKRFVTGEIGASSNVISITVSDIKPREATITVVPSNDDPYIVAFFESAYYEGKSDKEIIDDYLSHYPPTPAGGEFSYTMTGLNPNTEYFVAAFGYEGGVVTTELFKEYFSTLEELSADITVELNIVGVFDLAEVAALNSMYQTYVDNYGYEALLGYEFKTTPQAASIQYGLYKSYSIEGLSDDVLYDLVVNTQIKTTFDPTNFVKWGEEYVILAIARDDAGNPSSLLRSEPILCSYDNRDDAAEFIAWRHQ
ncbi:MAG: hypothetical protein IKC12_04760 [Alistipes sp.]|nr:hypothetical protein [Alistipes sp.]